MAFFYCHQTSVFDNPLRNLSEQLACSLVLNPSNAFRVPVNPIYYRSVLCCIIMVMVCWVQLKIEYCNIKLFSLTRLKWAVRTRYPSDGMNTIEVQILIETVCCCLFVGSMSCNISCMIILLWLYDVVLIVTMNVVLSYELN